MTSFFCLFSRYCQCSSLNVYFNLLLYPQTNNKITLFLKIMAKSRLSSTSTTPDLDINNIQLQNLMDFRNDKRFNNINYVRHVLRKFFGNYTKKFSLISQTSDDQSVIINDNLISPILIHPCLQFDKHTKFSGKN